jgi:hypothetical protein
MTRGSQNDLFQTDDQSELFGENSPTPEFRPDPDTVRSELYQILAEARAAQKLPWEPKTVLLYRTIFPQMTRKARNCALSSRRKLGGWKRPDTCGWVEFFSISSPLLSHPPTGLRPATLRSSFARLDPTATRGRDWKRRWRGWPGVGERKRRRPSDGYARPRRGNDRPLTNSSVAPFAKI